MKCPFCDAIVPAGSGICNFCGEPIPCAVPATRVSSVIEVKTEDEVIQEEHTLEMIAISEGSDASTNVDKGTTILSAEPDGRNLPEDNMPEDKLSKEEIAPAIDLPEVVSPKPTEPEHISAANVTERDTQASDTVKEATSPARKAATAKPKLFVIVAVLLFLCGVTIGGIFFGNRQPQESALPTPSQESSDRNDVSNHENQTIVTPDPSEVTDKPLDEADTSEQNELEISPNENKTAEKIEEPIDSKSYAQHF